MHVCVWEGVCVGGEICVCKQLCVRSVCVCSRGGAVCKCSDTVYLSHIV